MPEKVVTHRGLSFRIPAEWTVSGQLVSGDASLPGGVRVTVAEERRARGEPLAATARRILKGMRDGTKDLELLAETSLLVGGERGHLLRLRYPATGGLLGALEHLVVVVDAREPSTITKFSLVALETTLAEHEDIWTKLLASVHFDEELPKHPRIRPHRATFELPPSWQEVVTWELGRADLEATLVVQAEPRDPKLPFASLIERRLALAKGAGSTVVASTPRLAVGERGAYRIATQAPVGGDLTLEEVAIIVDGGPTGCTMTSFLAAALARDALGDAEELLDEMLGSVRFEAPPVSFVSRKPLVVGASLRGLRLAGRSHAELHGDMMGRGFVPTRVPLAAATTRTGERRFSRIDGTSTSDRSDPRLASEWIYAHEDGGVVRLFPHGHGSLGLGGVVPPSARMSIVGGDGHGIDAELVAVGADGPQPKTIAAAHGLVLSVDPRREHAAATRYMRTTWVQLAPSPVVPLPLEDRVGLPLTRTLVFGRDFEDLVPRVERLAASANAIRSEVGGRISFLFSASQVVGYVARITLDLGTHAFTVDPLGVPSSVERLQRTLRQLTRGERYRVFDDATGEDVTETALRLPSFLVAPTRRRPRLFATDAP